MIALRRILCLFSSSRTLATLCVVFVFLFIFSAGKAIASTYYISPTGSDSANGSSATPWATLVKAMQSMKGGDTLIVNDGTYTGAANAITHNGTYPPYGTASAYTTIQAAHDGMAIFDGQSTVDLFNYEANSVNDAYWQFEGLIWCHNPDGNVYMDHITHVKFFRCGAYDCGDGNNINFAGGNSTSYCLFENCYGYGSGRYKFMFYLADHDIIRSCVGRGDRMNAVEPMANFAIYSSNYCEVQNCIAIDTDQTAQYSADEYDGGFLVPATDVSASYINFTNCINLNNTSGAVNTDQNAMSYYVTFSNCVFWANSEPEDSSGLGRIKGTSTTFTNCTFGNMTVQSGATGISAYPGGRSSSVNNTIFYDFTGTGTHAVDYFTGSDYNAYYGNTANYGPDMTPGAHDKTTIDPVGSGSLKYITRIESGSPLKGAGQGGADIGANINTLIGTPGTLWGDTGYNVDTGVPMWPFPNESLIRTHMAAYNGYSINGARGFCAGTTTLTKYIWQYMGNGMPASIYTLNPPTNLTATALQDGSISLTWVDNSDSETGLILERKNGSSGAYLQIASLGPNAVSYIDKGVTPGITYFYRIVACSANVDSCYSNEASCSVASSPGRIPNDDSIVAVGQILVLGSTKNRGVINPDDGDTAKIYFKGTSAGTFECMIFTLNGERIWQEVKDNVEEGVFEWTPKGMASGCYVAFVRGPGISSKKKLIVMR